MAENKSFLNGMAILGLLIAIGLFSAVLYWVFKLSGLL